eukprot:TRINITY_DN69238_c0_g1_i1.p2 TRINITY_DN69238_c0_g1~~TRINITY_DN69238_c0_g1_i1.p2  ORF type:complete len:102 (-),score=1.76 TRINITY_DN69238_c0_g1_i1:34-339(-)
MKYRVCLDERLQARLYSFSSVGKECLNCRIPTTFSTLHQVEPLGSASVFMVPRFFAGVHRACMIATTPLCCALKHHAQGPAQRAGRAVQHVALPVARRAVP